MVFCINKAHPVLGLVNQVFPAHDPSQIIPHVLPHRTQCGDAFPVFIERVRFFFDGIQPVFQRAKNIIASWFASHGLFPVPSKIDNDSYLLLWDAFYVF